MTSTASSTGSTAWNPQTDPELPAHYAAANARARATNRAALAERFGIEPGEGPLFGLVSRLTWQKGIDIVAENVDWLVSLGGSLAVLGSGDSHLEAAMTDAAERHPGRVGFVRAYDEALSHLMQGGADVLMVPSRFEPCGLTQLYGLRYGAVPLVSRLLWRRGLPPAFSFRRSTGQAWVKRFRGPSRSTSAPTSGRACSARA